MILILTLFSRHVPTQRQKKKKILEEKVLKLVQNQQWRHQDEVKWRRFGAFIANFTQKNASWVPSKHFPVENYLWQQFIDENPLDNYLCHIYSFKISQNRRPSFLDFLVNLQH